MLGHFTDGQRMCLLAAELAERMTLTKVKGDAPLQVRQREVDAPVAAVGRPEQTKERLVLVDREQLAVAQGPALRGKPETHDSDFRQEWFSHRFLLLAWMARWKWN